MNKPINITPGIGNAPCKGCERRAVGCHGQCEAYKAFREDCDAIRSRKIEEHRAKGVPPHWLKKYADYAGKYNGKGERRKK